MDHASDQSIMCDDKQKFYLLKMDKYNYYITVSEFSTKEELTTHFDEIYAEYKAANLKVIICSNLKEFYDYDSFDDNYRYLVIDGHALTFTAEMTKNFQDLILRK